MALQTYDSQDAVPEAQRASAIETKDGKFIVAEFEDVAGLKAKNEDLIRKQRELKKKADIVGDRTPEEVAEALEFAAKTREEKAKAAGEFETLKLDLVQRHNKVEAKLRGKLYDVLAKREAEAAIVAAGGNPKVLLPHVLPFVKVAEQDDDFVAQVVDAKGAPRIADTQGSSMSIAQLVETFSADETFGVAFAPSGAAGGGARNSGNGGSLVAKTIQVKKGDMIAYRAARTEAEKTGAQVVLV